MTDEIKEIQEIRERHKFRTKQMETFERLDSLPEQWEVSRIEGFSIDGYPIFDPPYDFVFPYYEDYERSHPDKYAQTVEVQHCQLCGHIIKYQFPIENDIKMICMFVGSECINNFKGAYHVKKIIKIYKEDELRYNYMNWLGVARIEVWKRKNPDGFISKDRYNLYKKLRIHPSNLTTREMKLIFNRAVKCGIRTPYMYKGSTL